jgi:hypothetical protein
MKVSMRPWAIVVFAILGSLANGIASATIPDAGTGMYHACMLKATGTLRMIDPSRPHTDLRSRCTQYETEITWGQSSQQGAPGKDGTSVTAIAVAPGDAFCPAGGTQFTVGTVVTYACHGTPGSDGMAGSLANLAGTPCVTHSGGPGTLTISTSADDFVLLHCGTTVQPPGAVTNLQAMATAANQVQVLWNAGATAASYHVFRSTTSGSAYAAVGTVSDTTFTDFTASPSTTYHYIVQASNAAGDSAFSGEVSAITSAAPTFGLFVLADSQATCTQGNGAIITFAAVQGASGYVVGVGASANGAFTTTTTTATDAVFLGVPAGTSTIHYFIAAFDSSGIGAVVHIRANVPCS